MPKPAKTKEKTTQPKGGKVAALIADAADSVQSSAAEKPPLPTTAGEVNAMSLDDLNTVVEAHNLAVTPWLGQSYADKKAGLIAYLALEDTSDAAPTSKQAKKGKTPPALANDPLQQIANEIENLGGEQAKIENAIKELQQQEGVNDFKLGGLLQKLDEVAQFGEAVSFKNYVHDTFGIEYRKARYLIAIYNTLLNVGVSWEELDGVGWTKIVSLLPIITKENVAEWVQKAKTLNNVSLKAAVKAAVEALAKGEKTAAPVGELKTKTFKLAPDQLEVVDEALNDAKKKSGTDAMGQALEYVCAQYLSADPAMAPKVDPQAAKKLVAAEEKVLQLQQELAAVTADDMPSLRVYYKHLLEENAGDVSKVMETLFGAEFDDLFPGILVSLSDAPVQEEKAA